MHIKIWITSTNEVIKGLQKADHRYDVRNPKLARKINHFMWFDPINTGGYTKPHKNAKVVLKLLWFHVLTWISISKYIFGDCSKKENVYYGKTSTGLMLLPEDDRFMWHVTRRSSNHIPHETIISKWSFWWKKWFESFFWRSLRGNGFQSTI